MLALAENPFLCCDDRSCMLKRKWFSLILQPTHTRKLKEKSQCSLPELEYKKGSSANNNNNNNNTKNPTMN